MMMRGFLSLMMCCLLWGTAYSQITYDITGVWENGAGRTISVRTLEDGNVEGEFLDSVVVTADGTFALRGKVNKKKCAMLMNAKNGFRMIFLDGKPLRLTIKESEYSYKNPSGPYVLENETRDQAAAQAMIQFWSDDYIRNFSLGGLGLSLKRADTRQKRDSIAREIERVTKEQQDQMEAFLKSYSDSDVAPFFIEVNMLRMMSLEQISAFYDRFTDRVKQTEKGKEMGERIAQLKRLAPGSPAPEFELTTPDGKKLALKDLRGHIVLIDFWASWCGPCRKSIPFLKKMYQDLVDQGLEIISISIDKSNADWLKALDEEQLPWPCLIDTDNVFAEKFDGRAIPMFILVDGNGIVVEDNLRDQALKNKIEELIRNK